MTLCAFLEDNPLGGGVNSKEWIEKLLRTDRSLGLRIMETRYAYASQDFEWDQMKRVALEGMDKDSILVLRDLLEKEYRSESDE